MCMYIVLGVFLFYIFPMHIFCWNPGTFEVVFEKLKNLVLGFMID